jgi:hypothetical protein
MNPPNAVIEAAHFIAEADRFSDDWRDSNVTDNFLHCGLQLNIF